MNLHYLQDKIDWWATLEELGIETAYPLGDEIMCHCPNLMGLHAHGDKSPSFGFNTQKLEYNCFVCGGGNVLLLLNEMLGLDEEAAEMWLRSQADLDTINKDKLKDNLKAIMNPIESDDFIPDYPPNLLFQYRKIHPYLYERGLTKEVIVDMQVGWSEEHDAIIIPHFYGGKLCGWQMRHLNQIAENTWDCKLCSESEKKVPKYKNTSSFPKATTLYNYDNAIKYPEVIVVESPMTALYLMSCGYPNVVATFGGFNPTHGMLLARFQKIFFWPDNDGAGLQNLNEARKSLAMYSQLMIVPLVPGEKSDAANLKPGEIPEWLNHAYSVALYPMLGLATLEDIPDT